MPFAAERLSGWTMGVRYLFGGSKSMAINVETKDCTALSDAELTEMADLCADLVPRGAFRAEVGHLGQLRVAELCAVLGDDVQGHRSPVGRRKPALTVQRPEPSECN